MLLVPVSDFLGAPTLSGTLPGNMHNLMSLGLVGTAVSGTLPTLPRARIVICVYSAMCAYINPSPVSGTIPANLTSSGHLLSVVMMNMRLSGSLPEFRSPDLHLLILNQDLLSCKKIPPHLNHRPMEGTLPLFSVETTPSLQTLTITKHSISGSLSESLFELPHLASLKYYMNRVSGRYSVARRVHDLCRIVGGMQCKVYSPVRDVACNCILLHGVRTRVSDCVC